MTSYNEVVIETVDLIKEKNIPLYQAIPRKHFSIEFAREFIALSKKLEELGLKDFKVRTPDGLIAIQSFGIASALTYLKIHNESFDADDFLSDLDSTKDGHFQFGYLLSSTIDCHLSISDKIDIYPYKDIKDRISTINKLEIEDFMNHTSPEFKMNRDALAVLLVNIPVEVMVFDGEANLNDKFNLDDMSKLPAFLAKEKLKEIQELICLISDKAIKILVSWGSYSDQRLDYILGMKPNKNREYYSEGFFSAFVSCMAKTDWGSSKEFYELILQVERSKELSIALNRISSSMSNDDFMGKVLDLSVAMEVMCVSGRGDNTYKVANHISWLCSQEPQERLKIMKSVRDFYNLRSSIVHGGKYSKSAIKSYRDKTHLYETVLVHVKSALIELLKYGKKPNWDEVAANGGLLHAPKD